MSDLVLHSCLFMLATLRGEFFRNEETLLPLISIMMCFLDGPLVVMLMWGFVALTIDNAVHLVDLVHI